MRHKMTANDYCELSLRARLAVALVCFDLYCQAKRLRHPMLNDFLERMWELPCINSLRDWESRPCVLVHAGLGDSFPQEFEDLFHRDKLLKREFRELLESTVEIIYCSAYGKGDNAASLRFLDRVLRICSGANVPPPSVEPFSMSLFADDHGWGKRLSTAERDAWRSRAPGDSAI
jgi:hypothetical protein